jgi:hypothetical protein
MRITPRSGFLVRGTKDQNSSASMTLQNIPGLGGVSTMIRRRWLRCKRSETWSSDSLCCRTSSFALGKHLSRHNNQGKNTNQSCRWTDIFFVPRSYFQDFITLSSIFSAHEVFLEVALPTMVNIIDLTRQRHPHLSVITKLADCFGGCCSDAHSAEEILWSRCGHRLNHQNNVTVNAQMGRLKEEADALGSLI